MKIHHAATSTWQEAPRQTGANGRGTVPSSTDRERLRPAGATQERQRQTLAASRGESRRVGESRARQRGGERRLTEFNDSIRKRRGRAPRRGAGVLSLCQSSASRAAYAAAGRRAEVVPQSGARSGRRRGRWSIGQPGGGGRLQAVIGNFFED